MPVIDGYKTIDIILQEVQDLGVGEFKIREAIRTLGIEATRFNADLRARYYSPQDVERIKNWLKSR
jgi:hypothetical protein